jgi:hypothetical protein
MIVNVFVLKHKKFKSISGSALDLFLWLRFESAILKLLESDPELLDEYFMIQDQITEVRPEILGSSSQHRRATTA